MLADRISAREGWRQRAAEVGRLVGEDWTDPPPLRQRSPGNGPRANIRPEAVAAVAQHPRPAAKPAC